MHSKKNAPKPIKKNKNTKKDTTRWREQEKRESEKKSWEQEKSEGK
jgi:hypothetical protein